jgi:hypothetical protein
LSYSLENRRIDLITVSSYEGISEEREPRLPALFPDDNHVRARKFPEKKVNKATNLLDHAIYFDQFMYA